LSLLLGIPAFFVILAALIFVHELGHFTVAKLAGVRVDEFGLGFPPRLKTWTHGDTVYSVNAIPLGGFVKMQGENGESWQPDSFGAQSPWKRLCILAAGPVMNLVLAVLVLFTVYATGTPQSIAIVTAVEAHSPAQSAGLRVGDRILALDGRPIHYLSDLQSASEREAGRNVRLKIRRHSHVSVVLLVPRAHPPVVKGVPQGRIGVEMSRTRTVSHSPGTSLSMSVGTVKDMIGTLPQIGQNIVQQGGNEVSGPIGIAHVTTQVVNQEPQNGPGSLFYFVALLSANLGILNLLPIPALDGGRIVFVLISWIRRRNLDPELEGIIHLVGMAALLMLILFVSYQDIVRWVTGSAF
jgi:regulator of sigma E protease